MKMLIVVTASLIPSMAFADCLAEGDMAKSPSGKIGEVTYAHCDIDGYEAYTLVMDSGERVSFESAPDKPGALPLKEPVEITDPFASPN